MKKIILGLAFGLTLLSADNTLIKNHSSIFCQYTDKVFSKTGESTPLPIKEKKIVRFYLTGEGTELVSEGKTYILLSEDEKEEEYFGKNSSIEFSYRGKTEDGDTLLWIANIPDTAYDAGGEYLIGDCKVSTN